MSIETSQRIAIATCDNLPGWEIDDQPFLDLLRLKFDVSMCSWTDPDVDWSVFRCVLIRTTWDYSERISEFKSWIKHVSRLTCVYNDASWIMWNCDKNYLRSLESEGVHIAPTQWLSNLGLASLAECVIRAPDVGRWFLKPTIGASSSNTLRFTTDELETAQSFVDHLIADHDFMLQPYLNSVETFGEVSLLYIGGRLTHAVRKVPVPGDYRVQDDFGAHDEPYHPTEELMEMGTQVLAAARRVNPASPELLYARLDFLKDLNGDFALNELELIEPSLFFRHGPGAPGALVDRLLETLV